MPGDYPYGEIECPICGAQGDKVSPYDCMDLNHHCSENQGVYLPLALKSVYYFRCADCHFVFCPEMYAWSAEQFREWVYNEDYVLVDPGFREMRPDSHANFIANLFGPVRDRFRILDYGGGEGRMAGKLVEAGFSASSFDPFFDPESQRPEQPVDLITAFEVFEHSPAPVKMMEDMVSLLNRGGGDDSVHHLRVRRADRRSGAADLVVCRAAQWPYQPVFDAKLADPGRKIWHEA